MSYRTFTNPHIPNEDTDGWIQWVISKKLLLDVRTNIPEGVCSKCYGGTGKSHIELESIRNEMGGSNQILKFTRWPTCFDCKDDTVLEGILPISYSIHDKLESAIYRAKNDQAYRWLNIALASVLNEFLRKHLKCIERKWGSINIITIVPSHSGQRHGWDHLAYLIRRVNSWPMPDRWNLELLTKTSTAVAANHRDGKPTSGVFTLTNPEMPLHGKRVLLIDDTFTKGGTLRSAALAIRDAGGSVVAMPIGRQVRDNDFGSHIICDAFKQVPLFRMDRCAIHQ